MVLLLTSEPREKVIFGCLEYRFWLQKSFLWAREDIFLGSGRGRFRYLWTFDFQDASVCILGCKRLHPGLQTLASVMINLNNHTLNLWYSITNKPPFGAFPVVYYGDYVFEVILKRILGRFCPLLASYECGWKQPQPNMMDSVSSSVIQKVSHVASRRA